MKAIFMIPLVPTTLSPYIAMPTSSHDCQWKQQLAQSGRSARNQSTSLASMSFEVA